MNVTMNLKAYNGEFIFYKFNIRGIQLELLDFKNDKVKISYINEKIKMNLELSGEYLRYIKGLLNINGIRNSFKIGKFVINHRAKKLIDISITIPISSGKLLNHDFSIKPFSINKQTKHKIYDIEFKISKKQQENLKVDYMEIKKNFDTDKKTRSEKKQQKKKNGVRNTSELKKKAKEAERPQESKQQENNYDYKHKRIYLTHPNAYRRCGNCANFTSNNKCSSHKTEVSINHTCRRFFSYKTVLGGGFSPR
ncbi:hypothetical protein [Peribacillus asahii]|uniref:hypothetical protein n=1 Tax=Peribacillus asahii TaxID=228899 RepID=UPI002079DE36|nr:hypothetical protein [Peribacillus asahii]USK60398.1 hypothetical protein LIT37_03335 [Peribacillus asahii]